MSPDIQASGTPRALLENDARQPENDLLGHPVWKSVFDGTMPRPRLKRLLLGIAPAVAGPGRYAFAAKVSQIGAADGKDLFLALYDSLKVPEANADDGWRELLAAAGASTREIADAFAHPSAEAADFVEVVKMHGLRSSPVEASVIAWMLERHLPRLWAGLADALEKKYGVPAKACAYLRYQAAAAKKVEKWVDHLVESYVVPASPYKVFEGRRAGREAVWAWTVLIESA